jgi:hypothetical protein
MMFRILGRLAAAVALAGCSMVPGIQREEAIEIALRNTTLAQPVVIEIRQTPVLWAITVRGVMSVCLAIPGNPPCVERVATSEVSLDRETGEILGFGFQPPEH